MTDSMDKKNAMDRENTIRFVLDGKPVMARPGETIWQVAEREGLAIPHLCYTPKPGYRADGNCRACMVEIEGERVLAASCIRQPAEGMEVRVNTQRARTARQMVMELLLADQPPRHLAHDDESHFWHMAERLEIAESRFDPMVKDAVPQADPSHVAMRVNLDACIHCNLCVRACREVQVNDVIGMAHRGHGSKIVFDFDDPMGESTCVACGECVQACPTGALMESSRLNEQGVIAHKPDRQVESLCPYCGVGCQLSFNIAKDRILYVEGRNGPANHNRLCVKGRFGFDYVHHPHRLTTPLIRRDDMPKTPGEQIDPANPFTHFREASWEEALDKAGGALRAIRDTQGKESLAGFGCAKGSNEEAYLFQKLVRIGFGSNNVDHCTRLCHASSVAALMETIGSGAVTAPVSEVENAECAIVIGARPTQNHPVAATFIKNAVRKGTRLIVIDPRSQGLSRYATHDVRFRPGTDVALLNAILHVIIDEGLVDRQYIEKFTQGYLDLKAHVKDFTPEEMAPICDVEPEMIRNVAREFASAKAGMIFWGMGISQHVHGTDNSRCLISLALITGNVGRPGTGLHPLRGQNNVQGASDVGLIPMVFPDYQPVIDADHKKFFEEFWGTELSGTPGLTVIEIMQAIAEQRIRGLYIMGENPAMSDPDAEHARAALARLEMLVVQDIFLTETAFLADVVLPASAFPEKTGTFTNTDRRVQLARQAIEPPGKARQDWWIIQEMARQLGLEWHYEGPSEIYEEFRQCMPSLKGISWKRLEDEGAVTYPCDEEEQPGSEIIFGEGFPTHDGKGKLVPASLTPPDEQPDENFPMILTTGRLLEHWHTGSMTRRSKTLDRIEPEAFVHLSPAEMDQLGLNSGDKVRIETRRGTIESKVRSDRQIPGGIIFMPFCFSEAPANILTNPALDPFGKIPELKYCAARLKKIETGSSATL